MTKQSPPKRGEIWHLDFGPKKLKNMPASTMLYAWQKKVVKGG